MSLKEQLKADMKEAMRNKEITKRDTIRFLNAAIKQIEVDERRDLDDTEIIKLIQKAIKQRDEAASQFKAAGREDLYDTEIAQAEILREYLPKQLTQEELEVQIKTIIEEVKATSMKDIGKVMGSATKKLAGTADGKRINEMTKKLLS